MPILTATIGELCKLTDTVPASLRGDRFQGRACAAFGAEHPILEARVLLADGIAWGVRDDLNRSGLLRRAAANITRAFWPEWAEALSRIEHRGEPIVFSVAERRDDGVWWCGSGRADQLPDFVRAQPPLRRLFCVNVAQIMLDMTKRAERLNFDLSNGTFILPPDDPTFVSWMQEFRAKRDAVQKKFDPLHAKAPPLTIAMRKSVEAATCLH
jgi:hypothetical protein